MKKLSAIFFLFMITNFCSCEKKEPIIEEGEEMEVPTIWEKSIDISEFIAKYESGTIADENIILEGKVTTSDIANNNHDVFIQDNTGAISLSISKDDYYTRYPLGTELFILASELQWNKEKRNLDLGDKSEEDHIHKIDQGSIELGSIVFNINELTDDDIGQFVKILNVQFDERITGKTLGEAGEDLILSKEDGSQIFLNINSDSDLNTEIIPYASGLIKGVIIKVDGQYAISPNSIDDFNFDDVRHSLFTKQTFEIDGFTLPYQIMYPKNYDEETQYPLIIFLHGAGERGNNNTSQMVHGPPTFANEEARNDYPAIVIFPQCPSSDMWSRRTKENIDGEWIFTFPVEETPNAPMNAVIELTKKYVAGGNVNPDQVYVMGLSMGGIGTIEFCYYAPEIPAAAISLAGGHDEKLVSKYGNDIAIRLYAGSNDNVVPPRYSQMLYDSLQTLPQSDAAFFLTEGRGHEWNYILNKEDEVLPWLWSKTKN